MHYRIHPIFNDSFLASLDRLPKTDPPNDADLVVTLEILLTPDGRLTNVSIVQTSGLTSFDEGAIDSVKRAAPFGPPPREVVATDGVVYVRWQFHRDEMYACNQRDARLYARNPSGPPAPDAAGSPDSGGVPDPN